MANYEFVTIWRVKAPIEKVWELIYRSENWPEWWRGVEKVEKLKEGDANHVGALFRYTWKSKLPYRLIFVILTDYRLQPAQATVQQEDSNRDRCSVRSWGSVGEHSAGAPRHK